MKMKSVVFVVAFFALAGIFNCTLMEPAMAEVHGHHDAGDHDHAREGHCDAVCNVCHHIWNIESGQLSPEHILISGAVLDYLPEFFPAPPARGIFHPPAVL